MKEEKGMMRIMAPQRAQLILAGTATALVALAIALSPTAAAAAPTLTITKDCDTWANRIQLGGLPAYEPFTGWIVTKWNRTIGPMTFNADANGNLGFSDSPGFPVVKFTVVWAGGTLEATAPDDCTPTPGSPNADAGADQTVAPGTTVDLDGTGSTDPDGDPLTYSWTQTSGPPVTLTGAGTATPSFTAPSTTADLTFRLEVCDDGSPALCDTDTVGVGVTSDVPDGNDYAARVIVNQPTWANAGKGHRRRSFVVKVSNLGSGPFSVDADDVAATVLVNGGSRGTIRHVVTKTVKPGKLIKFRYLWRYRGVAVGDEVDYSGCVKVPGDPDAGNDCGSYATAAVAKP